MMPAQVNSAALQAWKLCACLCRRRRPLFDQDGNPICAAVVAAIAGFELVDRSGTMARFAAVQLAR